MSEMCATLFDTQIGCIHSLNTKRTHEHPNYCEMNFIQRNVYVSVSGRYNISNNMKTIKIN